MHGFLVNHGMTREAAVLNNWVEGVLADILGLFDHSNKGFDVDTLKKLTEVLSHVWNNILAIQGSPGTGKSYIVVLIAGLRSILCERVTLCAQQQWCHERPEEDACHGDAKRRHWRTSPTGCACSKHKHPIVRVDR